MNTKPIEQWDELDVMECMREHIRQLRKSLGEDNQPDPAYLKLEDAHYRIRENYYKKLREERATKAMAQREAELEAEAADNYTISFNYNVKGVKK